MRAKQVYLTGKERCAVQTMISLEIMSNIGCEEMGIEPAFDTEMLKDLYRKLAGFEWKEDKISTNELHQAIARE